MMISRVESPLQNRLRADSFPENKLPVPREVGNINILPNKAAVAQKAVAPGAIALTLLQQHYNSLPMNEVRQLEELIEKGVINSELTEGDRKVEYRFNPIKLIKTNEKTGFVVPQDLISDLGRAKLYINYDGKCESIKNPADFERVHKHFNAQNSAVMDVVSVACCQSFFADNWAFLNETLPETFFSSNGKNEYKIEAWIESHDEKNALSQRVYIKGEVTYKINFETDSGDRAEVKNLRVKGTVERAFYYKCPAPDKHTSMLQNDFTISYIPDYGKSSLAFEITEDSSSNVLSVRGRSQTQPAIPLRVKPQNSNTTKRNEEGTSHSSTSTSIVSDFQKEDQDAKEPIPGMILSENGLMKTGKDIAAHSSYPLRQGSQQSNGSSFFSRIRQAWSDITDTVASYWQRLKSYFSF